MKIFSVALLGVAALAAPAPSPDVSADASSLRPLPNSYVVVLNDDVADAGEWLDNLHLNLPNGPMHVYNDALKGFAAQLDEAAVTLLRANPQVAMVEPDAVSSGSAEQRFATYGLAISSGFGKLTVQQEKTYYYSYTGAGIPVYIIDSGVNNQPDFGNRFILGPTFVTEQNGYAPEPNQDLAGHGTAVAGCVGGNLYGTAKGATLISLKVLNSANKGHNSAIIGAIDYAVRNCAGRKCVINLSLGGDLYYPLDNAVQGAYHKGVTVVAAAGNNNKNACLVSPAAAPNAITVAAIDDTYTRADFSNFGTCVDLFSPGVNIFTDSNRYPHQAFTLINGTSFSAPYVSGIAAYYLSAGAATPSAVKFYLNHYSQKGFVSDPAGSPNNVANNGYFQGLN